MDTTDEDILFAFDAWAKDLAKAHFSNHAEWESVQIQIWQGRAQFLIDKG